MHPRTHSLGDRYGRLINIKPYCRNHKGRWYHLMLCDCGRKKQIAGGELNKGNVKSCGCLRKEIKTSHGMTRSSEYCIWAGIIQRCRNPKSMSYKNYGGRGITVCDEWMDFANFLKDMGKKPSSKHTIERVNNDEGYNPTNCIWADRFVQSQNQRIRVDNKTGFRGVSLRNPGGKYYAKICAHGKQIHLGCFDNIDDAVQARRQAEIIYFKSGDDNV